MTIKRTDKRFKFMIFFMCIVMVIMSAMPMITGFDRVKAANFTVTVSDNTSNNWFSDTSSNTVWVADNVSKSWRSVSWSNHSTTVSVTEGATKIKLVRMASSGNMGNYDGNFDGYDLENNSKWNDNSSITNWTDEIPVTASTGTISLTDVYKGGSTYTTKAKTSRTITVYFDKYGYNYYNAGWGSNNADVYITGDFDGWDLTTNKCKMRETEITSVGGSSYKVLAYDVPINSTGSNNIVFVTMNPSWSDKRQTPNINLDRLSYYGDNMCIRIDYNNNASVGDGTNTKGGTLGSDDSSTLYGNLSVYSIKIKSLAGKKVKFVDMTANIGEVTAQFTGDGLTASNVTVTSGQAEVPADSNGKAYTNVQFYSGGSPISGVYNLFDESGADVTGVAFAEGTLDTFYYGITTVNNSGSQGTAAYSEWGVPGRTGTAISSKQLYLNRSDFGSNSAVPVLDGTALTATSNPEGTGNYSHSSAALTSTANHIYHLKTDSYFYNFYWTDSTKDLVTLSSNAASVSEVHNDATVRTIYFDATLSKLSYAGTTNNAYEMPIRNTGTINYVIYDENDNSLGTGTMSAVGGTNNNIYTAEISSAAKYIMFYSGSSAPSKVKYAPQDGYVSFANSGAWSGNTTDSVNIYVFDNAHNTDWNKTVYKMTKGNDGVYRYSYSDLETLCSDNNIDIKKASIIFRSRSIGARYPADGAGGCPVYDGAFYDSTGDPSYTFCLEIPNYDNPCFFADTSDRAIYDQAKTRRDGYWGKYGDVRDAESGKGSTVVDIAAGTEQTPTDEFMYLDTTIYDYYSDYELNGFNRDSYGNFKGASQRNWVNFRQFDQALSDYYSTKSSNSNNTIYTGHFQHDDLGTTNHFSDVAGTLGLYGYGSYNTTAYNNFFANNNSVFDNTKSKYSNQEAGYYAHATQNILNGTLPSDGIPHLYDNSANLPFFDENFLMGNNSKNTVLGKIYNNVQFPFRKVNNTNATDIPYWTFNSANTNLQMKYDNSHNRYFLDEVSSSGWSTNVDASSNTKGVNGYFPFNSGSTNNAASTYNYGFGTNINFNFRLSVDGKAYQKNGFKSSTASTFEFSGDDDLWIYVDNKLVLDVGGDHGRVSGKIEFHSGTDADPHKVYVTGVKKSANNSTEYGTGSAYVQVKTFTNPAGKSNESEHTLNMYYMERGLWESNLKLNFNMNISTQLDVQKEVDTSNVHPAIKEVINGNIKKLSFDVQVENNYTNSASYAVPTNKKYALGYNIDDGDLIDLLDSGIMTVPNDYDAYVNLQRNSDNKTKINTMHFTNQFDTVTQDNSQTLRLKVQELTSNTIKKKTTDPGALPLAYTDTGVTVSSLFDTRWEFYKKGSAAVTQSGNTAGPASGDGTNPYFEFSGTAANPDKVKFINELKTGTINIQKTIDKASPVDVTFKFEINLTNVAGIGLAGEKPVNTYYYVTIPAGSTSASLNVGVPINTKCIVSEISQVNNTTHTDLDASAAYYQISSEEYTIESNQMTSGSTHDTEFVNNLKTGDLVLTKKVYESNLTSIASSDLGQFTVNVTLSAPDNVPFSAYTINVNGTPKNDIVSGTSFSLTIQKGSDITISGLPYGTTYSVTEDDPTDSNYHKMTNNVEYADVSTRIDSNSDTVTINNWRDQPIIVMPETGGTPLIYLFPFGIIAIALSACALVIYKKKLQGASLYVKRKGRSE